MRWVFLLVGLLVVLTGTVWTLQGVDLLGGSPMSGNTFWAVVGPAVVVIGLILIGLGLRRRRPPT